MKKLRKGDQVLIREEHDYLGIEAGTAGEIVRITPNDDGTQEIGVNVEGLDWDELTMDSEEVKFLARNSRYLKAFQIDVGDVLIVDDNESGETSRAKVRDLVYVEEQDEIIFLLSKDGYLIAGPTDPVLYSEA